MIVSFFVPSPQPPAPARYVVLYEIYKYISLFVYVIIASLEIIYCTNCNNEIDIYNWYTKCIRNKYIHTSKKLMHSINQSFYLTNLHKSALNNDNEYPYERKIGKNALKNGRELLERNHTHEFIDVTLLYTEMNE